MSITIIIPISWAASFQPRASLRGLIFKQAALHLRLNTSVQASVRRQAGMRLVVASGGERGCESGLTRSSAASPRQGERALTPVFAQQTPVCPEAAVRARVSPLSS